MPHRYTHREISLKQTLDDALAEKASPAEDGHLSWRHCSVPRDAGLKFSQAQPAYRPSKKSEFEARCVLTKVYSSSFVCHWRKPIDLCRHDEIVLVETLDLLGAQRHSPMPQPKLMSGW
jgi:hypothetical protein